MGKSKRINSSLIPYDENREDELNSSLPYQGGVRFQLDKQRVIEEEIDRKSAARERRAEDPTDPSQSLVDGIKNIAFGGVFTQIDNAIPVSWPSFDVVESAITGFMVRNLEKGLNNAADTVSGRKKTEVASNDTDVNNKLPRKGSPKSTDPSRLS